MNDWSGHRVVQLRSNENLEARNHPGELDEQRDAHDGAAGPEGDRAVADEVLLRSDARENVASPERFVDIPRHDRGPEERGEHAKVHEDGGHLARHPVRHHSHVVGGEEDDLKVNSLGALRMA